MSMGRLASILLFTLTLAAACSTEGGSLVPKSRGLDTTWPISDRVTSSIISYQVEIGPPATVRGRFNVPKTATAAAKVPAVLYLHGTNGVDGRGAFNAFALNEAGIATLEIDMWGARNLAPGAANRAKLLPTLPLALGAYRFLAAQPQIDAHRIGVEGESMGGGIVLRTASRHFLRQFDSDDIRFAAQLAFYPNCTEFVQVQSLPPMTGTPVHILLGDNDEDTSVEDCQAVAKQTGAGITVFHGATHQWDEQQGRTGSFYDPLANRGAGGYVTITPSPETAEQSRAFGVSFFKHAFGG